MASSSDDPVFTVQVKDDHRDGGVQMHFELGMSDDLHTSVLEKYAAFRGMTIGPDSLRFSYNGADVKSGDTPAGLGMTDGDANTNTIRAHLAGEVLRRENIVRACTVGNVADAIELLSSSSSEEDNEEEEGSPPRCHRPLTWFDSDGLELNTPPIFIAIDYGHRALVEKMLPLHEGIIDTLMGGDGEYSALQWASWTGHLEIVKLLIENGGAKVDEEALSLAREYDHSEVAELLLKHVDLYVGMEGDADAMIEKACREGDVERVRKLLEEEDYDVTKWRDGDGKYLAFSPMYLAVKNGHMDVIQLFAEKGVQVDMEGAAPEASAELPAVGE